MQHSQVAGDIPELIENEDDLYEGDLTHYFRALFLKAANLNNPYHNLRHTLHVLWLCHKACRYYENELTPRQMRMLLIAALFHDFDHPGRPHPGKADPDRINIGIAIAALRRHITPEDRALLPDIEAIIEATHYPYDVASDELDLLGQIIRDADLAQALSPVWIQQIVIGLAQEWGAQPIAVLKSQVPFLSNLRFNTEWARRLFPPQLLAAKIREAQELLRLLETAPVTAA